MIIKEFLPNPIGNDKEGEYIKLLNNSSEPTFLTGWQIKDASGKVFDLSGSLDTGKELVLPYSETKISLNNNGEQVFLYNSASELVDKLEYSGQAEEGQIIQRLATSELATSDLANNPITNYQLPITKIIFTWILVSVILGLVVLYIIVKLEKKLDIKLW